jgi:hypothetical protein
MTSSKASPLIIGVMLVLTTTTLPAAEQHADDTVPDIELLEFLGSWQTPEGDYLDPLILAEETTAPPQTEVNDND